MDKHKVSIADGRIYSQNNWTRVPIYDVCISDDSLRYSNSRIQAFVTFVAL